MNIDWEGGAQREELKKKKGEESAGVATVAVVANARVGRRGCMQHE